MEEILEKLLNMRSLLDDVIKWIEDERNERSTLVDAMENIIFNPKVFNTPEKLARLKQTISGCIGENPTKDEKKIDEVKRTNYSICMQLCGVYLM